MIFIDCEHMKVRDGQVANRPIYVAPQRTQSPDWEAENWASTSTAARKPMTGPSRAGRRSGVGCGFLAVLGDAELFTDAQGFFELVSG
ncbi:hypothetical protein GCM10009760_54450 [Kitasatospora kazusensis]|uniref:Transposase n=1 Tax=Kitasatospora kazusensis TaxID=407974 RepID=A0ABN3A735_9ACTN